MFRINQLVGAMMILLVPIAAMADDPSPVRGRVTGTVSITAPGALISPHVGRAVVYLESHPSLDTPAADDEPAPPTPMDQRPHIAQRNKTFIPDFLVVEIGTWVEFPNWDEFNHNVFSRSQAAPPFDLDRYPYGQSKSYEFSKVGVVQVFCNIHPQMRATVVVTPNRYHARVDDDGSFAIDDIPPGEYELVAWHARCAEQRMAVTVVAGEAAAVAMPLEQSTAGVLQTHHRRQRHERGVMRGLSVRREALNLPVIEQSHEACCPPTEPTADEATD
jgi:plastocyanin